MVITHFIIITRLFNSLLHIGNNNVDKFVICIPSRGKDVIQVFLVSTRKHSALNYWLFHLPATSI